MHYSQYIKSAKENRDLKLDSVVPEQTIRIVVTVVAIIAGIYVAGKCLRIMGDTVKDVRYFVDAITNK